MRKPLLLLFVLLALSSVVLSEETNTTRTFEQQTEASSFELIQSWQLLAVFGLIISGILVALGYGIGIGMEMPELKAWAGTELKQIIATAIMIIMLLVVIAFIDTLAMVVVNTTAPGGLNCDISQSCLQKVSLEYLKDYISGAESGIKDVVKNNMKDSAWTGRGLGIYATSIKLGQLGISTPLAANYMLDVDRHHIVYEYYSGMLSSLYSQKFFLSEFCFKIGPIILAIGIVARSFFFSRKTGGLLIAVAVGVMFVFPAMYLFDWMTLDMILEGDNSVVDEEMGCPEECRDAPALAYSGDVLFDDTKSLYAAFNTTEDGEETAKRLSLGEIPSAVNSSGDTIYSCNYDPDPDDNVACPYSCRDLPYPPSIPACADLENQTFCANLDERCKVIREVPGGTSRPEYLECPDICKMIPPLKSDCSPYGDCLESRFDCRAAKKSDLDWRPQANERTAGYERCVMAEDCPASLDPYESCVWVLPDTGSCDDLCFGCPSYCRIRNGNEDDLSEACFDEGELIAECLDCSDACKIDIDKVEDLGPVAPNCTACPPERRIMGSTIPEDLRTGDCSYENCPGEYRVYPPRSACEDCIMTPETYLYSPPINLDCGELCKPQNNMPMRSSGDYTEIGQEGLVGRAEIRNVSKYMIPAYLLPLFNIVATLVFIKSFSGMIGGDIEIPGVSKLF